MLPPTHRYLLVVMVGTALVVVAATTETAAARTQPEPESKCDPDAPGTIIEEIPLLNHRAAFPINAHKNVLVAVELPDAITDITIPRPMVRKFYFQRYGEEMSGFEFKPRTAPSGSVTSITLKSGRDRVTMRVKVTKAADEVKCLMYRVARYSLLEYWKAKLRPHIDGLLSEQHKRDLAAFETQRRQEREEVARREREQAERAAFDRRASAARVVLRRPPGSHAIKVRHVAAEVGAKIRVHFMAPEWHDDEFLIPFELKNPQRTPLQLTGILVTDEAGIAFKSELLVVEATKGTQGEGVIASVPPRGAIRGVLGLPSATGRDLEPLRLAFMLQGARPAIALVPKWYPLDQESVDQDMRAEQVLVSARMLGGKFWMDDAIDSTRAVDGTSFAGIGMHINKGISSLWAFEAEAAAGRTSRAHFSAATWDNMQGDLTRQMMFGRLRGSGMLRFGDRQIVSVRAGLGVQFAIYQSTFSTGGMPIVGPGEGIVVDGVWTVGAGYEARLGDSWSLGIDGTFDKLVSSDARMLEVALRFGYRWTP